MDCTTAGVVTQTEEALAQFTTCNENGARTMHLAWAAVSQAEGTSWLHSDQEVHGIARPGLARKDILTAPSLHQAE